MRSFRRPLLALLLAVLGAGFLSFGCSSGSSGIPAIFQDFQLIEWVVAANRNSANVSVFEVRGGGQLQNNAGSPFAAGGPVNIIKFHPSGAFIYASSFNGGLVFGFAFNGVNGALTPLGGFPLATVANDFGLVMDRTGSFLYIIGATQIDGFAINPNNGALTRLAGFPLAVAATDLNLGTIDASNRFLYAVDTGTDQIFGFTLNQATGALAPIAGTPIATGGVDPLAPNIEPGNLFLYVAHGNSTITGFSINANTGALLPLVGFPVVYAGGAGTEGSGLVSRNAQLFVSDDGPDLMDSFIINPTTGALTPVPGYPVGPAGVQPAFLPTRNFLYLADFDVDNINVYRIDPGGAATLIENEASGDGPSSLDTFVFSRPIAP
ncbi:MAG: beta-propeller fold lactonase family protein [Armatimonadetes bacterium]|nr:beta-propeller fold lactonase family protein [Armatimonadota bacterium]